VDAMENVRRLTNGKCVQPNSTNIVRSLWVLSGFGPCWLGGMGGEGSRMMTLCWREPQAQLKPKLASRGEFLFLSFSFPWPDSYPILTVGREIAKSLYMNGE
jgi:hypothetical protein